MRTRGDKLSGIICGGTLVHYFSRKLGRLVGTGGEIGNSRSLALSGRGVGEIRDEPGELSSIESYLSFFLLFFVLLSTLYSFFLSRFLSFFPPDDCGIQRTSGVVIRTETRMCREGRSINMNEGPRILNERYNERTKPRD